MSEDLRTDHVKLESPSILTIKFFFCPAIWGAAPPLSTPVSATDLGVAGHISIRFLELYTYNIAFLLV